MLNCFAWAACVAGLAAMPQSSRAPADQTDAIIIERLESPTERIIMQLRGFNQAEGARRVVGSPSRGP